MSTETSRLVLAVDSSQVRKATGDLDNMGRVGRNEADGLAKALGGLKGALAGLSAAVAVRQIVQQADAYANLNARLQLATRSATEFAAAQTAVFGIAQSTRAGLAETADLFGSLSRATEALGVNQADVLGVTKTINQALAVSGTSAAGAAAALLQLGQGFASGTLRGEELNSVLEQAPRLARALADGLGVPVGALRKLGEEGELTAEKVFKALQGSAGQISKEFDSLPLTVGAATTQASNSLLKFIGVIDQAAGASKGLASAMSGASGQIDGLTAAFQRGQKDSRGYLDTLILLAKNAPLVQSALILARRSLPVPNAKPDEGPPTPRFIGSENDARRGRGLNREAGSIDPRELVKAPVAPAATISEAQRYLESLRQQLQNTQNLSAAETVLADIQAGRLGKVSEAQRVALIGVADQIDAAKRLQGVLTEQARQEDDFAAALKKQAEAGRAVFEATRTPAEQLSAEIGRLNDLLQAGAISWDTYARAQLQAQDSFDKATEETKKQVQETDSYARDLGLTFSSAFEDAVVGGNNLRSVLKGLADDLVRLVLRKSVTEPLANAIGRFISGGLKGARANGGPVSAGGTYLVGERGPEYLRMGSQGGSITPNDKIGGNTYVTVENNSGGSVRQERSQSGADDYVRIIVEKAHAVVNESIAGGGSTARALQSRGVDLSGGLGRRR